MKYFHALCFYTLAIVVFVVGSQGQHRTQSVDLNAAFDDSVTGAGGVRSDGGGAYSHGVSSETAAFQANGHLVFSSGSRRLNFVYSTGLDGQTTLLGTDSPFTAKARSYPTTPTGYVPMQLMAAFTSQCLGMTWEYSGPDGFTRNASYHYGTGDQSQTAYITVSYDGNSWIIQPSDLNSCSNGAPVHDNSAVIKDSKTVKKVTTQIVHGHYSMPFRITLTRK